VVDLSIERRVLELRSKGLSYREIGKILGISHTTVWRILKKYQETSQVTSDVTVTSKETSKNSSDVSVTISSKSYDKYEKSLNIQVIIQGIIEHLRVIENNVNELSNIVNDLKMFKEIVMNIAKLRIEGPSKCKYINDYGYCIKLTFLECLPGNKCLEVTNNGVKMFYVKVIENPLICITCPYYKSRKRW